MGLARTFAYYVKFPESRWNEIKITEKFYPIGNEMHERLGEEYGAKYRTTDKNL